jgi:hypothetical protein
MTRLARLLVVAYVVAGCSVDSNGIGTVQVNDGGGGRGAGGSATGGAAGGAGGSQGGAGGAAGSGGRGSDARHDGGIDLPLPVIDGPALGANGRACRAGGECASGFCVDDVCCDSACQGTCSACSAVKTGQAEGSCRPVQAGLDPDEECDLESNNLCGRTGACNGGGACALAPPGLACGESKCMGSSLTPRPRCNGTGKCEPRDAEPCPGDLRCASATACKTMCASDADCNAGSLCKDGRCGAGLPLGATCDSATAGGGGCASGNCIDGFCCESACTGACMSCAMSKTGMANGRCAFVRAGLDPDNDCRPQEVSTCGLDGQCNGQGGCRKWPDGTTCGTTCCSRGPGNSRPCSFACHNGACDTQNPMPQADACNGFSCCCPTGGLNGEAACVSPLACPAGTCS